MRVCLRKISVLVELWNEVWYSEAEPPWLMRRGGVILLFPKGNTFKRSEEDMSEKTGPARFWELIKGELATVLIVNLLFLITCIPVITIPPALLSLHMVMYKIVLGRSVSCVRDYFAAFKQSWKRAYGAFFLTVVPMGIARIWRDILSAEYCGASRAIAAVCSMYDCFFCDDAGLDLFIWAPVQRQIAPWRGQTGTDTGCRKTAAGNAGSAMLLWTVFAGCSVFPVQWTISAFVWFFPALFVGQFLYSNCFETVFRWLAETWTAGGLLWKQCSISYRKLDRCSFPFDHSVVAFSS